MKKDLLRIVIAFLVAGVLFAGLLWWLNSRHTEEFDEDCVYLSELTDEEITDLLIRKVEMDSQ